MPGSTRRPSAILAALTAVLALEAATASATPSLRQRVHAIARAHARPHGVQLLATVRLHGKATDVVIGSVTYRMTFDVYSAAVPGSSPSVDVTLERDGPGSPAHAVQLHDYAFNPQSGITFTYARKTLATAHVDSQSTIDPSAIDTTFTATTGTSTPCDLFGGGTGHLRTATGTLAYGTFNIVTSTSPFFGTLTTGPATAKLVYDPGCKPPGRILSGGRLRPCSGSKTLSATTGPGRGFAFYKFYGQPGIFQLAERSKNVPPDESDFDIIAALVGRADLSRPVRIGPHHFEAHADTAGDVFMTGSATFTSAPTVRHNRRCRAHGRIRRFARFTYRGTLSPDLSPLTAAFDTKPLALPTGTPATFVVRAYGVR